MNAGRDNRGRFTKGNKFGRRISDGVATVYQQRSVEARNDNAKVRHAVIAYLSQASSREGKTKMDDFIEKILINVFKNPNADISQLERLQRIIGEDPAAQQQPPPPPPVNQQDIDDRIATIRNYMEQEKHLTDVDEMTLGLLRYDLATLAYLEAQLTASPTVTDRYGATIPSPFHKERDRVVKRIMEYEKKLGLSPYDRKKLNSAEQEDSPLDKFMKTTDLEPDEL